MPEKGLRLKTLEKEEITACQQSHVDQERSGLKVLKIVVIIIIINNNDDVMKNVNRFSLSGIYMNRNH